MRPMRRVDQLLSSLGYGTRKEAHHFCRAGRVRLGDEVLDDASQRVDPSRLTLDGVPLEHPDGLFVVMHKPVGLVCSHDASEGPRVYDLLPPRWLLRDPKVTTVGRLDKDTSGLLLLTDQGPLVQKFTSPKRLVEKTYVATLDRAPAPSLAEAFTAGVELKEKDGALERTLPAAVRFLEDGRVEVTLQEGRYHQVRRMFAAVGFQVTALERTRFGPWTLGSLAPGELRVEPLPR
jgi:16S rRNA pseudouridine516 synthase